MTSLKSNKHLFRGELVGLLLGVLGLGWPIISAGYARFGGGINPYSTLLPVIFYLLIATGIYLSNRRGNPIFAKQFQLVSTVFFLISAALFFFLLVGN